MEPETNSLLYLGGYVPEIPDDLPDAPDGTWGIFRGRRRLSCLGR